MTMQELIAYALGATALGYLALRVIRKRLSGNCCGEKECPAAKQIVQRFDEAAS